MSKGAKIAIALIVMMMIAAVAGIVILAMSGGFGGSRVAENTLLEFDFQQGLIEHVPDDPFAQLMMDKQMSTLDFVRALDRAADDERVTGLVARISGGGMGLAQIQEVRDSILAFRAAGKKAIAWADTLGEFNQATGSFYLASAFDEIYLQPSGDVGLTGLRADSQFLRGTLDKLEVEPQMDHRYEYKNAMNSLTETEYTEPHRRAIQELIDSIFDQIVEGAAESRGMTAGELRELIDRGPFYGEEALEAGLVDGLAYRDEVYEKAREESGEDSKLLFVSKYLGRADKRSGKTQGTVALVYGVGAVQRGSSAYSPLSGSASMGSDTVARALRDAIDDEDVEAILFRVDSPGGSYVASDTIWRETVRAREAGKPVIVSMGNVAASGGYFVAMGADKIVAEPGTITGSIGVFAGKLVNRGLWQKLGMTFDGVQTSANATMWSPLHPYTEDEWQRLQTALDRIYLDFTTKVADGRGMEQEEIHNIAKGRVWSGVKAKELGLVDELGGFTVALDLTREAIGADADAKLLLKRFPRPVSPFEALFDKNSADNSEGAALRRALVSTLATLRPVIATASRLGLIENNPEVLAAPEWATAISLGQ